MIRLAVWRWTLDFALTHPFGGSFNSFLVNHIELTDGTIQFGRAFHSSHFEVLGELGWPGLAMYHGCMLLVILKMRTVERVTKAIPNMLWCSDLANAIQSAIMVFLTAGAFVGIAFVPMVWYIIAMSVSLSEYVRRVEALKNAKRPYFRSMATGLPAAAAIPADWRKR